MSVYTESEDVSLVSFTLISNEDQIFPFEVNSISGRICVAENLDFERKSFYRITVKAEDQKKVCSTKKCKLLNNIQFSEASFFYIYS